MEAPKFYREQESRLDELGKQIAALRSRIKGTQKGETARRLADLRNLESRRKMLIDRLNQLRDQGPGFRQEVKAELEKMSGDLSANVQEFVTWTDSQS
jgi:uncharacterized coiled-coil DUF342 family protein